MAFEIYKGGKKPPIRPLDMIALGDHLDKASTWPPVPPMGWEFKVPMRAWGMLGNDTVGDCAIAGLMHLIQGQSANIGDPLFATTKQALDLYSAVTGYDPNDPDTDQGTVLTDLLKYAKKHGVQMMDSGGKVVTVKILAWASLDVSSYAQVRYAAYTFGGNLLGINCPQKCETDTKNWNFAPGLPSAGGHCIAQEGEGSEGGQIVSWGMKIPCSKQFLLSYMDEGYIVLSDRWVDAQGKSPSGLDLNGLLNAAKEI